MNHWMDLSIQFANQRNYLDELFKIYPTIPEGIRDIDQRKWKEIEKAFNQKNKVELLRLLLSLDLFPIKDSYVAYLKRDSSAIDRNPNTVDRLYGRLNELGLDKIYEKCTEPKETNRQIGPLFKRWIQKGTLILRWLGFVDCGSFGCHGVAYGQDQGFGWSGKEVSNMDWVAFVALLAIVAGWLVTEVGGLIDEMRYWLPEDWCLFYFSIIVAIVWLLAKRDEEQEWAKSRRRLYSLDDLDD